MEVHTFMMQRCRAVQHVLFFLLLSVGALNGCGYSLYSHASLPFKEIAVDTIENRTLEPGLQDIFQRVLVEEFMKQGISVIPSAKNRVSAVIRTFDMPSLAEVGGYTREYKITVGIDVLITDENGQKRYIKNVGSPFMNPFAGSDDMGMLLATKRLAEEEALRDAARQLIGALIFK